MKLSRRDHRRRAGRGARDVALFVGGLIGVGHETISTQAERPTLLLLFAAMMGLPAFLRADERPDKDESEESSEGSEGE